MKMLKKTHVFLLLCAIIYAGCEVNAVSYDYSASIECLSKPNKAQYGGGIIKNPEFDYGLQGWYGFGNAQIEQRESGGNRFLVAHSRKQPYDSVSQKVNLNKDNIYTFSAWIQVSDGSIPVRAMFKTGNWTKNAGVTIAESSCWSMLKGGFTVDTSAPAELYFESNSTSTEIRIDSISLQAFTEEQWRSHQDESIEKERKGKVQFRAVDKQGRPLANAKITIVQKSLRFPIGSSITKEILNSPAYQNWLTSRFTVATFGDEMKWYSTETAPGKVNYSVADAMLQFTKQRNISVRGHNVLWDDPKYQPYWVQSLSPAQLSKATYQRVVSVTTKYKGQVIAWDVVNENIQHSFFESKLGENASAKVFKLVHKIDPTTVLFLNEYNTIEYSGDSEANPAMYLKKLREIQSYPGNRDLPMGIGLESHFSVPNLAYVRSSLDTLGATGLPMWITELDVQSNPQQAQYLEQILREAYSHPKVQGIVLWAGRGAQGCWRMCLTDANFKNLPTGDVVDKLLKEWRSTRLAGTTNANGLFEASLFHGNYEVKLTHPTLLNYTLAQNLELVPTSNSKPSTLFLKVSA